MDTCTPAHEVYGNGVDCLPYTGSDVLPVLLIALVLILAGIAMQAWLRRCDRVDAEAIARRRFHGV